MPSTIGMSAPITQTSWNLVSNLANDRPRFASGASRCTIESKACFAALAVTPTANDRSAAPPRPPMKAVMTPKPEVSRRQPMMMRSSVRTRRARGAAMAPKKNPIWADAATMPSCQSGSPLFLKSNANMKDRNPTMPRMRPIAFAACTMPAPLSSLRSISSAAPVATLVGGIRRARTVPARNTRPPAPTAHCPPPSFSSRPPGTAAATTASADSTVSFELASTSSSSEWTVPGITALLEIE